MHHRVADTTFLTDFLTPSQRADARSGAPTLDVADAFQAAIDRTPAQTTLYVEAGLTLRVRSKLTIARSLTLLAYGATIVFDFPVRVSNSDGGLLVVRASNTTIEGLTIRGCGRSDALSGANRYGILCSPPGRSRYTDICIRQCRFVDLMQHSGDLPATLTVMHAAYFRSVDRLSVMNSCFDTLSGAGIYLVDTREARIHGNDFFRFGWSAIVVHDTNYHWSIADNRFSGTTSSHPSYWGAAIDVMGQTPDQSGRGLPDEDGLIVGNRFVGGTYRYGQVLRLSSSRHVVVQGNLFDRCDAENSPNLAVVPGSSPPGGQNNLIVLTVRDITLNNGPHKWIAIRNNTFIARGRGYQKGIYAITTSGSNVNTTPCEGLIVEGNQFISPDADNYFAANIVVHGFVAGYNDIVIRGNTLEGRPGATTTYTPGGVSGLVVLMSNAGHPVSDVVVEDNYLRYVGDPGAGRSAAAINIQPHVTRVVVQNNSFVQFGHSVLIDAANTGSIVLPT